MKFLVAAYLAIWLILFGYVFMLNKKQKEVFDEIQTLKKKIEEKEK